MKTHISFMSFFLILFVFTTFSFAKESCIICHQGELVSDKTAHDENGLVQNHFVSILAQ